MATIVYEIEQSGLVPLSNTQTRQISQLLLDWVAITKIWISTRGDGPADGSEFLFIALDALDADEAEPIAREVTKRIASVLSIQCTARLANRTGYDLVPDFIAQILDLQSPPNSAILVALIK